MLEIGLKGNLEQTVTAEKSAARIGSGLLDVYATPMMVAMMEETCHTSVAPFLNEGQTTVGTALNIQHLAATPIGLKVRCESELTAIDRRKLVFKVTAFDEREEIGRGIHERFIVDCEKFMQKANGKK